MPVAADDVVWLDVLPSMNKFRPTLQAEAGAAATGAGAEAGTKFTNNFSKHLKVAAVLGTALAIGGAAKFMQEATREASNLGESLNAVKVTFGENAEGINQLGRAAAETVGLSQSQFNGLAVQFSAFATNIAGDGGDVVGVMRDLTTRGADFASVMNLDVNEAMGTFQSGLAGETEPLRKYGIDLSAAAVENYALANGIIKAGEEMTEAQKVQARYGSLMEQTSKVTGDFTNTSDSFANSQRILAARWDDIQATVGMKVIPVLERFSGWVLNTGLPAIQNFGGWAQDHLLPVAKNLFENFRTAAETVLPKLGTAFGVVSDAVMSTVGFFREHEGAAIALGAVVGAVAGMVAAAWVAQATVSTINAAKAVAAWFATATASTTSATIQSRSTAQIVVGWIAASGAAVVNAAKVAAAWAVSVAQTGILMAMYAGQSIAAAASSTAAWIAAQARTVASLVATGASFVAQGAVMAASMAATAARVVAGWVLMGAQSLLQAARIAAAWVLAMGPVGWVIATVVGLVALIIANWETVKRWTIDIWNAVVGFIKDAASAIWSWVVDRFNALRDSVITIFNVVRDVVVGIWNGFRDVLIAVATWIWERVVWYFTTLKDGAVAVFTTLRNVVVGIWNGFRDTVLTVANWIWDRVVWAFNALKDGAVLAFTTVRDTVVRIWNGFRDTIVGAAQNVWDWVVQRFTNLKNGAVRIFEEIRDTVGRVWDGLVDKVKAPIRIVFTFVNDKMIGPINSLLDKFPGGLRIPTLPRFRKGGYTGDGHPDEPRGIVEAGEYVFTQEQVKRIGLPRIEEIANGAIPTRGEYAGRDIGGPMDFLEDAWDATGGKVVSAVGDIGSWVKDMAVKGARKVAEAVLNPLANAAKRMTPDNVIGNVLDGAIDRLMKGVLGKGDEYDKQQAAAAADGGSFGGAAGAGSVGGGWTSIWNFVKSRVPQARINSTYRAGDPGYHGRGKAIDFGFGTGPGGLGSAGLALIKRVLHDGLGRNLAELIYNGVGNDRNNIKNGSPLAYNRATQLAHRNHVHAAVYDQGGLWEPGTAGFNFSGGVERVLTPRQTDSFERLVDLSERNHRAGVGSERPVHLYTPDIPHAVRALKALEQEEEALAPAW